METMKKIYIYNFLSAMITHNEYMQFIHVTKWIALDRARLRAPASYLAYCHSSKALKKSNY